VHDNALSVPLNNFKKVLKIQHIKDGDIYEEEENWKKVEIFLLFI